jgi:hypothetical protein
MNSATISLTSFDVDYLKFDATLAECAWLDAHSHHPFVRVLLERINENAQAYFTAQATTYGFDAVIQLDSGWDKTTPELKELLDPIDGSEWDIKCDVLWAQIQQLVEDAILAGTLAVTWTITEENLDDDTSPAHQWQHPFDGTLVECWEHVYHVISLVASDATTIEWIGPMSAKISYTTDTDGAPRTVQSLFTVRVVKS